MWVADVIFVYDDDFNFYWMSSPETRHSRAITESDAIAGTITKSTKSKEPNLGLQFEGTAEQLDGSQLHLIGKHTAKRQSLPAADEAGALLLLGSNKWYAAHPSKLHLIDELNFGFDRQEVLIETSQQL